MWNLTLVTYNKPEPAVHHPQHLLCIWRLCGQDGGQPLRTAGCDIRRPFWRLAEAQVKSSCYFPEWSGPATLTSGSPVVQHSDKTFVGVMGDPTRWWLCLSMASSSDESLPEDSMALGRGSWCGDWPRLEWNNIKPDFFYFLKKSYFKNTRRLFCLLELCS